MIGTISIEDVVKGVVVNGENVVDYDGIAKIVIPDPPEAPVKDVKVDGESVVDSEGVANITIPDPPEAPVKDVKVDGESVVDSEGVANITIPDPPEAPVKDVKVNGESVVNAQGVANVVVPVISNLRVVKQLPGVPAAVVTVSDAEAFTMPSLKVAVEAWQEGSDDPSPSNVRPIHGWDSVNVNVSGVNIWDEEWEVGRWSLVTGNKTTSANSLRCKNLIPVKPNETFYFKNDYTVFVGGFDANDNFIGQLKAIDNTTSIKNKSVLIPHNCYFVVFYTDNINTYNNDISINYPSTDTDYHAYNGHTYTINLNGTRYGGRVEIVNGIAQFEVTKGYIESYNGETLPSDWISDRDVYSEGATPTIGAEVVYTLSEPIVIPLGNYPISSLEGENNIFADSGNVLQGEYASNIKVVDIG